MSTVPLEYLDQGDGLPLVLVHGFPLDRQMWDGQRGLGPRYRLVVPNLRGFGEHPAAEGIGGGTVPMDQHADDLAALLDDRGLDRVVLGGLSMGGYVAFAFWRRHPHRVRALVLADTRAAADSPEGRERRGQTAIRLEAEGSGFLVDTLMPQLLAPASLADPALAEPVRAMIRRQAPSTAAAASRGMAERPDSTPLLASIAVPTLVVVGEHDAIAPVPEARAMAEAIPGSELAVIPGAGHLAPLEAPAAFNAALDRFLQAL